MLAQTMEQTPRFVVTLEAPLASDTARVRVPLAVTGKWIRGASSFSITVRDLEEIVRNFQARQNGEINVDYDHASEMPEVAAGGPIPSAGRIVKLDSPEPHPLFPSPVGEGSRTRGGESAAVAEETQGRTGVRFILWGWYEPTERARELIHNREYRYISPAINWTARDKRSGKPQGTTLTSVALTNRPFLEELPQIRLSDPAYEFVEEPSAAHGGAIPESPRRESDRNRSSQTGGPMKQAMLSVADGKIRIAHEDFKDEYFADPDDLKRCLEQLGLLGEAVGASNLAPLLQDLAGRPGATLSECVAEITQRLAGAEISLAQATGLLSEADARGKALSAADFFRSQVERELEEAVRAGKVLPRQREDWRKIALSDLRTFRRLIAGQKTQVPLEPAGLPGATSDDAQAQVKFLAEQRMRERHITFGQALSDIGREQPDLIQQYRRAVSSRDS